MGVIRNGIVVLFILLIATGVNGQFNYKPGRIITNSNDTLFGLISDGGGKKNSKYCKFKADKNSKPVKYYPKDIKSYWFIDDKYYSSEIIPIKNEPVPLFCEVLIQGKVGLLNPRVGKNLPYYLKLENDSLVPLLKGVMLYNKTNAQLMDVSFVDEYKMEVHYYRDTLKKLFKGSGIPAKQFKYLEYNDKSLQRITKAYIDSTCQENCNYYEKDINLYKSTYGFFSGIQFSRITFNQSKLEDVLESDKTISVPIGIFYNIRLPLVSDRLSFQLELLESKLSYNPQFKTYSNEDLTVNMHSNVISIPLFFKYGIKMKKFTPSLGFGKEFGFVFNSDFQFVRKNPIDGQKPIYAGVDYQIHWWQRGGWFFDLGFEYKIHPKYSLFSSIRLQRQFNELTKGDSGFSSEASGYEGTEYITDMVGLRVGISF